MHSFLTLNYLAAILVGGGRLFVNICSLTYLSEVKISCTSTQERNNGVAATSLPYEILTPSAAVLSDTSSYPPSSFKLQSSEILHFNGFNRKLKRCRLYNMSLEILDAGISSRCFFKRGSSSTPCMEFRMVTHMQGSTVSNLKFQCMTVHFSVNKVIFY